MAPDAPEPGAAAAGAGAAGGGAGALPPRPANAGAAQLVELAQGPQYLCKMDPLWHPWY